MSRQAFGRLVLVIVLALGLLPATAQPALAAAPSLTLTSDTRYDVDPEAGLVHVSVGLTAVNHLKDTKTRQYYFDRAFLAVQPGTANFAISAASGTPTVKVASAKADHTLLQIDFGRRLPAGSSRTFTLTFDITDPGGAPTRDVRIGPSLVSFSAWAFASPETPGGSVAVVFPAEYSIEVQSDQLGEPTTDGEGRTIYASGRLADPLTFFAYFVADRPASYVASNLSIDVGGDTVPIVIRSWPDDPAWATRVTGLVERGLPILAGEIGLPWFAEKPLAIAESISRSAEGYSGRYDPATGRIDIAYYAGSFVVLHEIAHAWFDGNLLAERWANEGFASWYALQAAATIEEPVTAPTLTPELAAHRVQLNDWAISDGGDSATDAYGYAASAELALLIAERAGPSGLASVWEAARERVAAYQPAGLDPGAGGAAMPGPVPGAGSDVANAERTTEPPDWRGLLDLLEDRTGERYDDLWRTWVVRPEEAGLLTLRATTRREYADVVGRAGEWRLPAVVRQAMRAWQFDEASELLGAADLALDDRDSVASAASAAGLEVPRSLEAAFESDAGFAAAAAEADAQLATIEAYESARDARPAEPTPIEQVGLWWATPDRDVERAAEAFGSGDLRASVEASSAAFQAWTGADETGRSRIATIIGAIVAALIAVWLVISAIRGIWRTGSSRAARLREARRRRVLQAHPLVAGEAVAGGAVAGGADAGPGGAGDAAPATDDT
jgi:hypothetical protein